MDCSSDAPSSMAGFPGFRYSVTTTLDSHASGPGFSPKSKFTGSVKNWEVEQKGGKTKDLTRSGSIALLQKGKSRKYNSSEITSKLGVFCLIYLLVPCIYFLIHSSVLLDMCRDMCSM